MYQANYTVLLQPTVSRIKNDIDISLTIENYTNYSKLNVK